MLGLVHVTNKLNVILLNRPLLAPPLTPPLEGEGEGHHFVMVTDSHLHSDSGYLNRYNSVDNQIVTIQLMTYAHLCPNLGIFSIHLKISM